MGAKLLSILIPVYNQEELIVNAINSIPVRDDIEIIVVDDASTDNTVKNVLSLGRQITVITISKWKPTGFCRNLCLKAATGKFIMWLDSDDKLDTIKFIKFIDFLSKNINRDVIHIRIIDNNGKIFDGRKAWGTCTKISKLDIIRKYDIKFPEIVIAEDKSFWNSLKKHCVIATFYNEIFYYYNHPREGSSMWNHTHRIKNKNK